MIIWLFFILFSPLLGCIGSGWFCFMGTTCDYAGKYTINKTKWRKPILWTCLMMLAAFLFSAFAFYMINTKREITHGFDINPFFLEADFNTHYKVVWAVDVSVTLFLSLILDRHWFCKNFCVMGFMCSLGARHSRLLSVVDTHKCTKCGRCEKECLTGIPIVKYVNEKNGLITNMERILCGKCAETYKLDAIKIKFVWNSKKYRAT